MSGETLKIKLVFLSLLSHTNVFIATVNNEDDEG